MKDKTIEDRAKEYYDNNHIPRDSKLFMSGEYYYVESLIEMMIDFHKQELSNALPSDGEIEKLADYEEIDGAKWLKQQILNNIK